MPIAASSTTSKPADPASAGKLLGIAPYLFVKDVQASAAFYSDKLGFCHDRFWGDPPSFCMTRRDGFTIMLAQAEEPTKIRPNSKDGDAWDVYIWVENDEAIFQELKQRGAEIVYEPSITFYNHREFAIRDPDGYIIAFGQDVNSASTSHRD